MRMDQLLTENRSFEGVLELAPDEGGPFPAITWGDHFFYYAPDRWRANIHVGRQRFVEVLGADAKDEPDDV